MLPQWDAYANAEGVLAQGGTVAIKVIPSQRVNSQTGEIEYTPAVRDYLCWIVSPTQNGPCPEVPRPR